jgi:hypothetical protein
MSVFMLTLIFYLRNFPLEQFGVRNVGYKYRGAFPATPQRDIPEEQGTRHRRLQTPLKRYVWYLFIFFALLQVMGLLIDFQYLRELNANFGN